MRYQCTSFANPDEAIVTTNDVAEYDRLMSAGGTMLCHPDLFSQLGEVNDSSRSVEIPYSVQIPVDKLAQIRSIPKCSYESYETRLY